MYVCIYVCMYVRMYVYVCMYVYKCLYLGIYALMNVSKLVMRRSTSNEKQYYEE